jgi:uncharacterized protein
MIKSTDKLIQNAIPSKDPKDVVYAFLNNTGKDKIRGAAECLVEENAIYVSLNFENTELKEIEPWCGKSQGRQVYIDTFSNVGTYWKVNEFTISDLISEGEIVAVFGQFTYTSVALDNTFTSPFSIKARVVNGMINYFQFMEDTYASAASFRASGAWTIQHKQGDENKSIVGMK